MFLFSCRRKDYFLSTDIWFYILNYSLITKFCGTHLKFHSTLKCCEVRWSHVQTNRRQPFSEQQREGWVRRERGQEGKLNQEKVLCVERIFLVWIRGFPGLLRENPSSLLMLGWSLMSIIPLMILTMGLDFLARIAVSFSRIQRPMLTICSAMVDLSGR